MATETGTSTTIMPDSIWFGGGGIRIAYLIGTFVKSVSSTGLVTYQDSNGAEQTVQLSVGGAAVTQGTSDPSDDDGSQGDVYVETDSSSVIQSIWLKGASTWTEYTLPSGGGSGESNTASALGSSSDGESIVGTKSGVDLPFKRIKGGTNVTVTGNTNDITIAATDTGETNTGSNLGTKNSDEADVYASKSGTALEFRRLKEGTNITLTENTNDITITASGSGEANVQADWDVTDTTSDAHILNKPTIPSTTGLAPLASPAFTGTPTAPTPGSSAGDTQIATKKYVDDNASSGGTVATTAQAQAGSNNTTVMTPLRTKEAIDYLETPPVITSWDGGFNPVKSPAPGQIPPATSMSADDLWSLAGGLILMKNDTTAGAGKVGGIYNDNPTVDWRSVSAAFQVRLDTYSTRSAGITVGWGVDSATGFQSTSSVSDPSVLGTTGWAIWHQRRNDGELYFQLYNLNSNTQTSGASYLTSTGYVKTDSATGIVEYFNGAYASDSLVTDATIITPAPVAASEKYWIELVAFGRYMTIYVDAVPVARFTLPTVLQSIQGSDHAYGPRYGIMGDAHLSIPSSNGSELYAYVLSNLSATTASLEVRGNPYLFYRGTWVAGRFYRPGDLVNHNQMIWMYTGNYFGGSGPDGGGVPATPFGLVTNNTGGLGIKNAPMVMVESNAMMPKVDDTNSQLAPLGIYITADFTASDKGTIYTGTTGSDTTAAMTKGMILFKKWTSARGNHWLLISDPSLPFATQSEAQTGTDTDSIMTPERTTDHFDRRIWSGTQTEYDAISTKNSDTLYFITS